ncbi:MAG: AraC family transcriptional regulator [Neisseriaceae bacterium]|nr:AraC family transcriptional regulator [Neisseriaceae bacterium]MBP6862718.1 AraC family transcriptional regulator [Neisseriaceae bacterium]
MFQPDQLVAISQGEHAFEVASLNAFLSHLGLIMPLINALPNVTFFVKNTEARYQLANEHLAKRCKVGHLKNIIGKRAEDVFLYDLGLGYTEQDHGVMTHKKRIINQLELHSYQSGVLGWCLTTKVPIIDPHQNVVGVAGISVDLQDEKLIRPNINAKLSRVEKHISQKFDTAIKVQDLANLAELSISQLDRQFKSIFQMTPQQLIQKKRLEYAIELLAQDLSITDIASRCGYTDHSAFSRKFKELTTMTPSQFKKRL